MAIREGHRQKHLLSTSLPTLVLTLVRLELVSNYKLEFPYSILNVGNVIHLLRAVAIASFVGKWSLCWCGWPALRPQPHLPYAPQWLGYALGLACPVTPALLLSAPLILLQSPAWRLGGPHIDRPLCGPPTLRAGDNRKIRGASAERSGAGVTKLARPGAYPSQCGV